MRARGAILLAGVVLALGAVTVRAEAPTHTIDIYASRISQFRIGSDQTTFGPFEFVGGLEMTSGSRDFGGLSGFRFRTPGSDFVGVADTGFWYFGTVERDAEGRPENFGDFRMVRIVDADGHPIEDKWDSDAEGIAVKGDLATVSFERAARISEFRLRPDDMQGAIRDLDFLVPATELRRNKGFETVAYAPQNGPLAGARVAIAERSIDKKGNIFAAVLEGPRKGVFKVARRDGFDISDGVFLPDGDMLLLERSYAVTQGVRLRLRRLKVDTIRPGGLADGPVLMDADMSYQIDNMEGIDVWKRADGATMVSMVSDDNQSLLQRNLYLEFRMMGE